MSPKYNNKKKTPCGRKKSLRARLRSVRQAECRPEVMEAEQTEENVGNQPEERKMELEQLDKNERNGQTDQEYMETEQIEEDTRNLHQDHGRSPCQTQSLESGSGEITGRRIIDIQYLFRELIHFKHIELFSCKNEQLKFLKEIRHGFMSTFVIKCDSCQQVQHILSEQSNNEMNINDALVLGSISTGGSYAQMQENFSSCNIPMMSPHTFSKIQEKLAKIIHDIVWEVIEQAGLEEKRIAIENGHVDGDGIPYITVIADGAWSKRSYKVNYNAASGVGVIVGHETRKVLFVGIRNKYCCVCSRAATKSEQPPEHKCFRNWSKPSTAMEADIIVEGFLKSIQMHGVRYAYLVGDGDSSVMKKLTDARPYNNRIVQKIECRNHLLRNYCGRLRDLTQKRISSKRETVPVAERNVLNNCIRRLRSGILCAVKYANENCASSSHYEKIKTLRKDILNAPYHVFGEHQKCSKYFCSGKKSDSEINWVVSMKKSGIFQDIVCVTERIVINAESLIINMDNNAAEHYNAILAKFVGGKRINFTMRRSYQTRCEAAAITYNAEPGELPRLVHKKLMKCSPGQYTKKYTASKSKQRNWRKAKKVLFPDLFKKKHISVAPADEDYGLPSTELSSFEYEKEKEEFLNSLSKTAEEAHLLQIDTIGQSHTLLWKEERMKRITASTFGKICKLREKTHCAATVKSMLYSTFQGSFSTSWGLEHESVAVSAYKDLHNVEIEECGLFVDIEEPYLGASPDGLIGHDGIVEIKCPQSASNCTPLEAIENKKVKFAVIKNGKMQLKKSHDFYYQVQGQLHITKRSYCVFIIWTPLGLEHEIIRRDDEFWEQNMTLKLKDFYYKCLLPEIINPQHTRNLPIKDLRTGVVEKSETKQ